MGAARLWLALLLLGFLAKADQAKVRLTDGQARDMVASTIHARYPEPCYSTYRSDRLESSFVSLVSNSLMDNRRDASVYFYRVASDNCDYVELKDGKSVRLTLVTMDCCDYGIVAVDRLTAKSYWFTNADGADIFKLFARDEQVRPDLPDSRSFAAFYKGLVWGDSDEKEIRSLEQLRILAQRNFESAYSPYDKGGLWRRKFESWWRRFLLRNTQLALATTYEPISGGTRVYGYGFRGFELTIPKIDRAPKGKPRVFQWTLLIKSDGTVEQLPLNVIYSHR